jgi:hypothetical protein
VTTLFLFGAGASYGSGLCLPGRPPLGSGLFQALQKQGGAAEIVSKELADLFIQDFEKGMDQFWELHNTRTTELLRDMARYFAQFRPYYGNCYKTLISALRKIKPRPAIITTNYDLLIELAISEAGQLVTYGEYPAPANNFSVLKIHGSCNFLPDMAPRQISGIGFDLSQSKGGSILGAGVRAARSLAEIIDFCDREDSIGPALALYSPSKQVLFCPEFVKAQQNLWLELAGKANQIYVIGLRVHRIDEHIWGVLAKSDANISYVGFEKDEFLAWSSEFNRKSDTAIAKTFAEALPIILRQVKNKSQSSPQDA